MSSPLYEANLWNQTLCCLSVPSRDGHLCLSHCSTVEYICCYSVRYIKISHNNAANIDSFKSLSRSTDALSPEDTMIEIRSD